MTNHLLSIFPINGENIYARVSLIALDETALAQTAPFTIDRTSLTRLLKGTSLGGAAHQVLADLDEGISIQVEVSESDAVVIAFYSLKAESLRSA